VRKSSGVLAGLAAVLAGCGDSTQARQPSVPYSIVKIEMSIMEERAQRRRESPSTSSAYDGSDFIDRLRVAGPAAVPELAFALESDNRTHRLMAADALGTMLAWGWTEAWALSMTRLERLPPAEEAGHLLEALASAHVTHVQYEHVRGPTSTEMWAKHRGGILLFSASYLDSSYVVQTISINHPDTRVEMRTCDYAAYLVQAMSGAAFGSAPNVRSDAAVDAARAWVRANMERQEGGHTILWVPDSIRGR
jgi:hypothetical protein